MGNATCNGPLAPLSRAAPFIVSTEVIMEMKEMKVSEDVLTAIQHVVMWAHGCEDPGDVTFDDVMVNDVPVLEEWLKQLGLLTTPMKRAFR
jgi:hypothetical protein